ncbi:hypothetical protein GPALN_010676 [Globodera pallida]|nr:hypothetical protein GPALN_010676 [Globodera pallida]
MTAIDFESMRNEVYNKFAEERPCWTLVVFAAIYTFMASQFKQYKLCHSPRELNGSANKLLAFYSLFEMVHQSGHFLFVYTVFSGHYLVAFPIAVRILSPSFFAFGCTTLLLFFTSIDRLLYVLFPLRTTQYENAIICCVVLPISVLFGAFYVCSLTPSNSNSNHFNMRIFRSLFIIVSVNISGYFVFDFFIATILKYIVLLPMEFWKWNQIVTIVLNVSAVSNAPILYLSSLEYRKAFRKELEPFTRIFNRNSFVPGGAAIQSTGTSWLNRPHLAPGAMPLAALPISINSSHHKADGIGIFWLQRAATFILIPHTLSSPVLNERYAKCP